MADYSTNITIKITNAEFDVIKEIYHNSSCNFNVEKINDSDLLLSFETIDNAFELDEMIKEKLVHQGFDRNYNINGFGLICESLIDKFSKLLNKNN